MIELAPQTSRSVIEVQELLLRRKATDAAAGTYGMDMPYHVLDYIGRGSYGTVFSAQHVFDPNRRVAIKVCYHDSDDDEPAGIPHHILRESSLMKGNNHPNVMPLLDVIQRWDRGAIMLVMPLHEGGTLDMFLREVHDRWLRQHQAEVDVTGLKIRVNKRQQAKRRRVVPSTSSEDNTPPFLTPEHQLLLAEQLLSAVSYLHGRRIAHRDIKANNLVMNASHTELVLTDFGLSRNMIKGPYTPGVGSLDVRPPEILLGDTGYCPYAMDLWSMGCVLFEIATTFRSFASNHKSQYETLILIFKNLGTPNETIWPGVAAMPYYMPLFPKFPTGVMSESYEANYRLAKSAPELAAAIDQCLRLNPATRVSAAEMRITLKAAVRRNGAAKE